MNTQIKYLALILCISLGSCGTKEAEVKKSITYLNQFTLQLLTKVNSKKNLQEGIKDAQAYLHSQKTTVLRHVGLTQKTSRAQVTTQTIKSWQLTVVTNLKRMEELKMSYRTQALKDKTLASALNKLVKDYKDLLQK